MRRLAQPPPDRHARRRSAAAAQPRRACSLDEFAALGRCNGAAINVFRPTSLASAADRGIGEAAFRQAVVEACSSAGPPYIVVSFLRTSLGQTGTGHFSPIAAYHAGTDSCLVLDIARFKLPPYWVRSAATRGGPSWRAHRPAPSRCHCRPCTAPCSPSTRRLASRAATRCSGAPFSRQLRWHRAPLAHVPPPATCTRPLAQARRAGPAGRRHRAIDGTARRWWGPLRHLRHKAWCGSETEHAICSECRRPAQQRLRASRLACAEFCPISTSRGIADTPRGAHAASLQRERARPRRD